MTGICPGPPGARMRGWPCGCGPGTGCTSRSGLLDRAADADIIAVLAACRSARDRLIVLLMAPGRAAPGRGAGEQAIDTAGSRLGRFTIAGKSPQVATPRGKIGFFHHAQFHEVGDQLRLVLTVAIDRDQDLVTAGDRVVKCRPEPSRSRGLRMGDHVNIVPRGQEFRRAVGRTVVDHEHFTAVVERSGNDGAHMLHFVVYRQGCQHAHVHTAILC